MKDWSPLSAAELLVWIGITYRMGTLGRARAGHYWCDVDGLHDGIIGSSMRKNRYNAITANLSFAPRGSPSGWAKISWLDSILRKACRAATGITQHIAVDESMIKCLSKFCPWVQYMPKKPIKRGELMVSNSYLCSCNCYTYLCSIMYVCLTTCLPTYFNRNQSFLPGTFNRIPL